MTSKDAAPGKGAEEAPPTDFDARFVELLADFDTLALLTVTNKGLAIAAAEETMVAAEVETAATRNAPAAKEVPAAETENACAKQESAASATIPVAARRKPHPAAAHPLSREVPTAIRFVHAPPPKQIFNFAVREPKRSAQSQDDEWPVVNARRKPRRLQKGKHNEVERKRKKHHSLATPAALPETKRIRMLCREEREDPAESATEGGTVSTRGPGRREKGQGNGCGPQQENARADDTLNGPESTVLLQTVAHQKNGFCGLGAVAALIGNCTYSTIRKLVERAIPSRTERRQILFHGATTIAQMDKILQCQGIAATAFAAEVWPEKQ
eukprot:g1233.t1